MLKNVGYLVLAKTNKDISVITYLNVANEEGAGADFPSMNGAWLSYCQAGHCCLQRRGSDPQQCRGLAFAHLI